MVKKRSHTHKASVINLIRFFLIIIFFSLTSSCEKKHVSIYDFDYNKWGKVDTVDFVFDVNDTIKTYELSFFFRNNLNYTYRNLFLLIELSYDDKIIQSDTVEYRIADKYGQWLGRGLGNVKDNYLMFNENARFSKEGMYKIRVRHGMRQDSLIGVNKLGFQIK